MKPVFCNKCGSQLEANGLHSKSSPCGTEANDVECQKCTKLQARIDHVADLVRKMETYGIIHLVEETPTPKQLVLEDLFRQLKAAVK
jgi:hypothetical protein